MQKKLTLIFMLLAVFSYSQSSIIKGRLLDKNTNDSLPYVSIGILKKGLEQFLNQTVVSHLI